MSHRDVVRIWERTLRRAGVRVAYSEGFSPRPRLSFGFALPTGYESDAEYLDVRLEPDGLHGPNDISALPMLLSQQLPVGMAVSEVAVIDPSAPSLQQAVTSCTWRIEVACVNAETVVAAVQRTLSVGELIVTRTRKGEQITEDIRPLLRSLEVDATVAMPSSDGSNRVCVPMIAELGTQPRAVRVPELMAALDPSVCEHHVHRTHQWINTDNGLRADPMPLSATAEAK